MAKDYITKYENSATNAEIAISGSEIFFSSEATRQAITKHKQNFNYLEIINDDDKNLKIRLDGLTTRERILFAKAGMVIKADDDIYFSTLEVINTSGSVVVAAGKIRLNIRIMELKNG